MQQAVEGALDRAEYIIESAQQRPPKRKHSSSGQTSLSEKLYDIYVEECEKEPAIPEELRSNVNLLEKLVRRESLPCLVVNLYPGKEGYSLMLKGKNGSFSESIRLPYEEGELLEYLDAEELPPVLVDLLEKSQVNVFHDGCVIAEIRDYRQSSNREPPGYQSRHILLRPTMQTLACDVEAIASDNQKWTQEDKLLLESQLILATAEPLCLDPSISVACTANRMLYNKQKLNTLPMKRSFKRFSSASLNRQLELYHCSPPPELRVLASCKKIRESKTGEHYGLKNFKAGNRVDTWKQRPCDLAVPSEVDVEKYAKSKKPVTHDDSQPAVRPAHEVQDGSVFGYEAAPQSQATKLTVRQPIDNSLSLGKRSGKEAPWERGLFPPHSPEDGHSKSFVSGLKTDARRVFIGLEELVQESAQCPGQMSPGSGGSAGLRQPSPRKEAEQPKTGWVQSSVLGRGAKPPPPPTRVPWHPGKSSWGDRFTSLQAGSSPASLSPAPAPEPPSKSSVELNGVISLPAATPSQRRIPAAAAAAQAAAAAGMAAPCAGLSVTRVAGPGRGGQASGSSSATGATEPAGIPPGHLPPRAGSPSAPRAAPPPRQVQLLLQGARGLRPLALVQLPRGSVLWNSQRGAQQPPPQRLYQLIPERPGQHPSAAGPPLPASQGPRAQSSVGPNTALPAPRAVVLERSRPQGFLQPQALVLSQPGSGQSPPRPNRPQQRARRAAALQLHWRVVQCQVAAATVMATAATPTAPAAPAAQPSPGQQTAGQSQGAVNRGPPGSPKS
ncbi:transcription factor SPT20 homolog [Camelus ferus]|uniref:Transcription factor SPT20 homolog n=2 Tax=Camelus TaxID=9836 RepID=A0A8B8SM21_CAMFR|nr:transcription factor SPT20 homolog [Camelus ferus]